ncbi:MAG: (Fe-S)-binding protein [Actinomycetota bacterium]|nr:(Fe-S)-binding protein [Actinomycetota bacterium]
MNIDKNILNTIEACRYCPMCKQVCSSEFVSYKESDTPRGRAILLYDVYEAGHEFDESIVESIYNCFLCGCCRSWCDGRQEGGYDIPELVKFARRDIASKGSEPLFAKTMKDLLIKNDNPFGIEKNKSFSADIKEKKAEVLYYMGPEVNFVNKEIAESTVKIFDSLKINYTVLKDENVGGSMLNLLGYFEDAKRKAEKLFKKIEACGCKTIVTSDPLFYDEFKSNCFGFNLNSNIKVYQLSEYLWELIKTKKLVLKNTDKKITLADSEFFGRYNNVFDPPRQVIKSAASSNFIEMRWNKEKLISAGEAAFAFYNDRTCLSDSLGQKICGMAKHIGAEAIITLSAAAKNVVSYGCDIKVMDISEFVADLI